MTDEEKSIKEFIFASKPTAAQAMIWGIDQKEIAKIVHDYIQRGIGCDYDRLNSPPPPIYIGPVKVKTLKERLEEIKMKTTSVQTIKNVNDISFSIENYPTEMERLTIVASTDDDIFAFEFEGPDLICNCKKSGLFTGWEKDLKIKELEAKSKDISNDNALLLETNKKLKEENEKLEKELGEWKKEVADCLRLRDEIGREKNREINKLHQQLHQAEIDKRRAIYEYHEENKKLKQENEKLKELKTPTIENFADKEPTSRRDILKAAEMCVCGQREQDYGTPESNFQLIADLWNDYLKKEQSSIVVDSMDVAMMMALLKIARIKNGGGSGDSFVDLAGYAACGGEIWYGGKTQVPEGE